MKKLLLAAALFATSAFSSQAATLGLDTDPTIAIQDSFVDVSNDPFFGLTVSGFGPSTSTGLAGAGDGLFVSVFGTDLDVFGFFGPSELTGTLSDTGFVSSPYTGADTLELLFDITGGTLASSFGDFALMTIVGEFGSDPFGAGFAPTFGSLTLNPVTSAVAPVPLPAALPMLVAGLGGLVAIRRRKTKAA